MTTAAPGTFTKAQPFVVGIGIPIAVALLCVVVPIVYTQGQNIQKLTDQVDVMGKRVDKFEATADRLDKHMVDAEAEPSRVLARMLGTTTVNKRIGTSIVIGEEIYVFPKDLAAQASLITAGYREKELSPTISGFVAQKPTPASDPVQRPGR